MSAQPNFSVPSPAELTGSIQQQDLPHPLQSQEGVFYPGYELPVYSSSVNEASVQFGKIKTHQNSHEDFGTAQKIHLTMSDEHDTGYTLLACRSANPVSDIWVVKDCAWTTQVDGLNTDVARWVMKQGLNMLVKGPEIGSSIPLSESAHNTHQVLNYMAKIGLINSRYMALEGYSRGSMVGFGTNAYAEQFGRKVIYSNLTDPCVARPIKADVETVKKAVTLPYDLFLLGSAVTKGLVDGPRGKQLAKSVDISPQGALQFIRTGKPLMNGEAGMMAARTPDDMQATIAFFRRCRVNDAKLFSQILGNRPGVRFVRPEGGHGGGIDSRIIGNIAVRFGRLAEQLAEGRQADELDYRHITHGLKVA